jgi:hypothetical protein
MEQRLDALGADSDDFSGRVGRTHAGEIKLMRGILGLECRNPSFIPITLALNVSVKVNYRAVH